MITGDKICAMSDGNYGYDDEQHAESNYFRRSRSEDEIDETEINDKENEDDENQQRNQDG